MNSISKQISRIETSKIVSPTIAARFKNDVITVQQSIINEVKKNYTKKELLDCLVKCERIAKPEDKSQFNNLIVYTDLFFSTTFNVSEEVVYYMQQLNSTLAMFEKHLEIHFCDTLRYIVNVIAVVCNEYKGVRVLG